MLILGLRGSAEEACTTSPAPFRRRAARPTWRCSCRRRRCRAGRRSPSATTSRGCGPERTAGSGRSIPKPASSASCRARAARPTRTAFDMIQRNTIFTNVALRPDGTPWWEGHDDPPPAEALDWQGRPWTPASTEKAAHPEQPVHDAGDQLRIALAGVRQPERRADRRDPVRRAAAAARSAGVRSAQLAARHVPRRDAVVGDDRGGDRQGRRAAARSDGDVAVLRLQHGRLLPALARRRREARRSRRRSSA